MNRRQFLKYLGKTGLGLAIPNILIGCTKKDSKNNLETKLTPANKELRNFPNKLYGAENIEKFENPNAEYCLARIKQVHFKKQDLKQYGNLSNFAEKKFKSNYDKINNIQENIAYILEQLKTRGNSEIFSEGYVKPLSKEDLKGHYNERIKYLINSGYYQEEFKNKEFEKFMHIPGADLELGKQGIIKILPTENKEILKKAHESENPSIYDNPRENYILENISDYNKPLSILVFGTDHNFKDNIKKWNSQNPENKFSLIEITPKSYKDERELPK